MSTHADKTQENKGQSVAAGVSQVQSASEYSLQFADNRPEAIAQRELHDVANNSPRAMQLKAFHNMGNNSPQAKQAAQLQAMADNHSARQQQPIQKKENNTGLPDNLKTGMENLSGYSMDDVKVHYNSDKPAQLQAHAYAQGTEIHLGSGQEKHLPHEAWHVVQQKQGRVKPTMQMNGGVNVNNDKGLENEADVMGANALQMKTADPSTGKTSLTFLFPRSFNPIQLKPMDKMVTGITHLVELVGGHLYNEDYESNERAQVRCGMTVEIDTDVRYRSRRGPNQEDHSETDESGEQHYLWYLVNSVNDEPQPANYFIREDTITHPMQAQALAAPLQSTIYGTDGSNAAEVGKAYLDGYGDYDCAFSYHGGGSCLFFRSFEIHPKRPVRIIYKFKLAEAAGAATELSKLSRTPGVIIHTVMLHEIPDQTVDIDTALQHLALLGQTYQCRVGVSNVPVTEIGGPADLVQIRKALRSKGVDVSVVENKMNPGVPDKEVHSYCQRNGIQYIAYGLTGPSSAGGTCGMVPGAGDGDYLILTDPGLLALAEELRIEPGDLRYVIYTWARQKHVSIIARSSQRDRRLKNKTDFQVQETGALESYGTTHEETGLYLPLYQYLIKMGVSGTNVQAIAGLIAPDWLEQFYRKAIVDLKSDNLTPILKNLRKLTKLRATIAAQQWSDITAMRTYFEGVLREDVAYPANPTAAALIEFLTSNGVEIVSDAWVKVTKITELNGLSTDDEVYVYPFGKASAKKTYVKLANGNWQGPA
jgi:diketogulonate reductase-like aldo/keto reductase